MPNQRTGGRSGPRGAPRTWVALGVALVLVAAVSGPVLASGTNRAAAHGVVAADAAAPVAAPVLAAYPSGDEAEALASQPPAPPPSTPAPAESPDGQPTGEPSESSSEPAAVDGLPGSALDPARVGATLAPLLRGGALGSGRTPASVIDVATGRVLYEAVDRPTTPASTAKLVTAVSALDALGPDAVLQTRAAVLDPAAATRRVVLVGGGDPTLASTPGRVGGSGTSIVPASLRQLARATAKALGADATVRVGYDATLFTGAAMHPTWSKGFPAGGIVAPVSALQVDQGRRTPNSVVRVADPALAAAERFVAELERAKVTVIGRIRSTPVRAESTDLAAVSSPPIDVIVERMLATSDNDIAEALARLAARAAGLPASFAGVTARARAVLDEVGPGTAADVLVDGSGLSRSDRLSPSTLTTLLREHQEGALAPGLPVAAATGSLRNRFQTDATDPAAGLGRLKTGTLTGVTSLAGFVSRPDGRLLAVAFVDGSTAGSTLAARNALDRAVAALVTCRCAVAAG